MIRETKQLERCYVHARDGDVGNLKDLYFDDEHWRVRYFVVDAGKWLSTRSVLIAPGAVSTADWSKRVLEVNLSREQVRNSPPIDTQRPVSRQHEAELHDYYGWPYYWSGAALGTGYVAPIAPIAAPAASALRASQPAPSDASEAPAETIRADMRSAAQATFDSHLRSVHAVRGYRIAASDGPLGHVEDVVVDDTTWAIPFLVVDTRNWWMGRKVMLAPSQVQSISWEDSTLHVQLTRAAVKSSPQFYRSSGSSAEYTDRLGMHLGWRRRLRKTEAVSRTQTGPDI